VKRNRFITEYGAVIIIGAENMACLFETEHLIVRKFHIADTQDLYNIHSEEAVKKWIPNESYADPEEAQDAIDFLWIVLIRMNCHTYWLLH
jgi:hypothetical protein